MFDQELYHYGTPRHSGRYPWGSGKDPYQHSSTFLSRYRELKSQGMTESEIAKAMGFKSTTEFRAKRSLETDAELAEMVAHIQDLKNKGMSNVAIGEELGINESSVRSYLKQAENARYDATKETANILKNNVDEKGYIDVGVGVERELGISKVKLDTAVAMLEEQGYSVVEVKVPQATMPGQFTTVKVLAPPGTTWADVNFNQDKIQSINDYSPDGGVTFWKPEYPASLDSSRVKVIYGDEGGNEKDGVIEIRRGVSDISLGESNYAQVRILVDNDKYMKGMAYYTDDLPDGVDVLYYSNKAQGSNKVFKKIENDPDNPFGASIKANGQVRYIGEDGKEHLGVVNKLKEEGDWNEQQKTLSSQFLSKQSLSLITRQLNLSYAEKKQELEEIESLTNPAIKKKLLESFADDCDASASHLKAAALPRQSTKVILPLTEIGDNEIYAPTYRDGEKVVLIRYPHGGTFEIPELTVNNKNKQGKNTLGTDPIDAVGINKKVADRLSGADFDGDTVVVIPVNSKVKVTTTPALKQLEGFDNKAEYPGYSGMKKMTSREKGIQMGLVSNLITDMTLQGAPQSDIARAVKHSMVVIDAEKHGLDYKKSESDQGIAALKEKYQGRSNAGASTLISRASSEINIPEIKAGAYVNKTTGAVISSKAAYNALSKEEKKNYKQEYVDKDGNALYSTTDRTYVKRYSSDEPAHKKGEIKTDSEGNTLYSKSGKPQTYGKDTEAHKKGDIIYDSNGNPKVEIATTSVTRMSYDKNGNKVTDARTLSSGTVKEEAYANYANQLKAMANTARKESVSIKSTPVSTSAKTIYAEEVSSLNAKLNTALKNAPKERQAQLIANSQIKAQKQANPDLSKDDITKISNRALASARANVGANKKSVYVDITDKEWEAIQAGAVSNNTLTKILNNTDTDVVKQRATPRTTTTLSSAKITRIQAMKNSGYTISEIADAMGVSATTVSKYMKE